MAGSNLIILAATIFSISITIILILGMINDFYIRPKEFRRLSKEKQEKCLNEAYEVFGLVYGKKRKISRFMENVYISSVLYTDNLRPIEQRKYN